MPVNIIHDSQFKNNVHIGPNVKVPIIIQHQLSVSMNYMFKRKYNSKLIKDAYNNFEERLQWGLLFAFTAGEKCFYDPDYEVPHVRKGKPPVLLQYLELGFQKGCIFVNQMIWKIPKEEAEEAMACYKSMKLKTTILKEFLLDNEYIVMNTDKNLGVAVSH